MPNLLFLALLAISLSSNAALGMAYLGQRDATTTARNETISLTGERDGARATAKVCTEAVDELRTIAVKRTTEATAARLQAQSLERRYQVRADAILSAPPVVPGNDCQSAQVRVNGWMQARVVP